MATYGPTSRTGRASSTLRNGAAFLEMLSVPCFALIDDDSAKCSIVGGFGVTDDARRLLGGDQAAVSCTYGGITIKYIYPSRGIVFITSEEQMNENSSDVQARQRCFEAGLVMVSGKYQISRTLIADDLEWVSRTVEVDGAITQFMVTSFLASNLETVYLLVGQVDVTHVAIVATGYNGDFSLRRLAAVDLDTLLNS